MRVAQGQVEACEDELNSRAAELDTLQVGKSILQAFLEAFAAIATAQRNASWYLIGHGIVATLYRTSLNSSTMRVLTFVRKSLYAGSPGGG